MCSRRFGLYKRVSTASVCETRWSTHSPSKAALSPCEPRNRLELEPLSPSKAHLPFLMIRPSFLPKFVRSLFRLLSPTGSPSSALMPQRPSTRSTTPWQDQNDISSLREAVIQHFTPHTVQDTDGSEAKAKWQEIANMFTKKNVSSVQSQWAVVSGTAPFIASARC